MLFWNRKTQGFTLTEVLLAVAIIGIIAALVLPATISKFDTTVMNNGFTRQAQTIQHVIDVLPVKENVSDFGKTTMYSDGSKSIEDSSGKFIKKYLRVAKYYGAYDNNADTIKSECFASKYYEYDEGQKKEFDVDEMLHGACAKLKNGASICLSPQVGANSNVQGVMDLNGPKPPNIYGRDLRVLTLEQVSFSTREAIIGNDDPSEGVFTETNPNLEGDGGYDNLCKDDYSVECCKYMNEQGKITSSDHMCCSNTAVASTISACANNITLRLNLYPSTCNNKKSSCRSYINASMTTAKVNNKGADLTKLPANPPDVVLLCSGKEVGKMSGSVLAEALIKPSGSYYFTKTSNASATCGYPGTTTQGISAKSSVVFEKTKGSYPSEKNYNNINWTVTYW